MCARACVRACMRVLYSYVIYACESTDIREP